jgi:hypothetical protein
VCADYELSLTAALNETWPRSEQKVHLKALHLEFDIFFANSSESSQILAGTFGGSNVRVANPPRSLRLMNVPRI